MTRVLALGELLWDVFPDGARFGGAPINFAHHTAALGSDTTVVTAVGDDDLGAQAIERLRNAQLSVDHVLVIPDLPTGTVQVSLDDHGVASYQFNDVDAWDRLAWTPPLIELAGEADVMCFGSLGQRSESSRRTIQKLVESSKPDCLRVFDVNLRAPFFNRKTVRRSIELANVLKLNEDELPVLVDWFDIAGDSPEQQVAAIADRFGLQLVALTRGSDGSLLWTADQSSEQPTPDVRVVDTVGAGDSFTAAMVTGLLRGDSLEQVHAFASRVAAYVCTHSGATPDLRKMD